MTGPLAAQSFGQAIRLGRWARLSLAFHAVVVLGLGLRGPRFVADWESFVDDHIIRTPGYPWFLDFFQAAGGRFWAQAVVLAQHVAIAIAAWTLARTLFRWLEVGERRSPRTAALLEIAIAWALFSPALQYANRIATEALAYALLCLVVATTVEALFRPSYRLLWRPTPYIAALQLVRPQFLFLTPLALVLIALAAFRLGRRGHDERRAEISFWARAKRPVGVVALAAAILLSQSLVVRLHHGVRYGKYIAPPIVGLQLIAMSLYVARPADERALSPESRAWYRATLASCAAKGLQHWQKKDGEWTAVHFYLTYWGLVEEAFLAWHHEVAHNLGPPEYPIPRWPVSYADLPAADAFLTDVGKKLLVAVLPRYVALVGKILWQGTREWGVLISAVTAFALLAWLRGDRRAGLLALLGVLWIGNRTFVALVQTYDPRYTFYTDIFLLVVIPLYVEKAWRTRSALTNPAAPALPG